MEARGYNPKAKRTKYNVLKWNRYDFVFLVAVSALLALYIVTSVLHIDYFAIANIDIPEVLINGKFLG